MLDGSLAVAQMLSRSMRAATSLLAMRLQVPCCCWIGTQAGLKCSNTRTRRPTPPDWAKYDFGRFSKTDPGSGTVAQIDQPFGGPGQARQSCGQGIAKLFAPDDLGTS